MYGYAIMNYMNLFARLSIYDANFVINVIQLTGQQQEVSGDFLNNVFDRWFDKVYKRVIQNDIKCLTMQTIV